MPGLAWEERMAKLAADRKNRRAIEKRRLYDEAVLEWLTANPPEPIPTRLSDKLCGHGKKKYVGPTIVGDFYFCECCWDLFPYGYCAPSNIYTATNGTKLYIGPGQDRCSTCGGSRVEPAFSWSWDEG